MFRLNEHPFINDDWLAKNENHLQQSIWQEGHEDFYGFGLEHFVAGTKEQEADFLRAYELRSNHMCYKFSAHKEYDAYHPIPEWLKHRLEDHDIYNKQITNENIENFNQAVRDTAHDVAWAIADAWQEFLGVKPSWAHKTIKEDWAKLTPPKEIWWEEEPVTDTETRILYNRLCEDSYFEDHGLWDRIEKKGHRLEANQNITACFEYQPNGEHYYGDEYEYDEDGIPTKCPDYGWGSYLEYSIKP